MAIRKSTFKRPGASEATAPARPSRQSRYAGIKATVAHPPRLMPGKFKLRIDRHAEGENVKAGSVSHKAYFTVVECIDDQARQHHAPGDTVYEAWRVVGAGSLQSRGSLKSYLMAACGYDIQEEAEFNELAGQGGELYEATLGEQNDRALNGADPVAGRMVDVIVLRGNAVEGKDDFYRDYMWSPAVADCGILVMGDDGIETLDMSEDE